MKRGIGMLIRLVNRVGTPIMGLIEEVAGEADGEVEVGMDNKVVVVGEVVMGVVGTVMVTSMGEVVEVGEVVEDGEVEEVIKPRSHRQGVRRNKEETKIKQRRKQE